jgi:hypothetical protein
MYNINVEVANLCLVPQYIVHEGIYELHSLMKTNTHVLCTVPWNVPPWYGSIEAETRRRKSNAK